MHRIASLHSQHSTAQAALASATSPGTALLLCGRLTPLHLLPLLPPQAEKAKAAKMGPEAKQKWEEKQQKKELRRRQAGKMVKMG